MNRLLGKRALVTGATSGIGLETAREFLREGARVAITGHRRDALEAARNELGDVLTIEADAGEIAAQQATAKAVRESFGGLDAVAINAGVAEFRPLEQWDEAGFDRSFDINFKGPFFLVQALAPLLANPSSIVLTTSINAHIGMPNSSIYSGSKAALLTLAKTLSGELLPRGVRVNAVSPGPIATPLHGKLGMGEKEIAGLIGQIPAGRRGSATEVAKAIVYFASDESAFTIGGELIIDGGMSTL